MVELATGFVAFLDEIIIAKDELKQILIIIWNFKSLLIELFNINEILFSTSLFFVYETI